MDLLKVLWTSGIVSITANGWVGLVSTSKKTGLHLQNSITGGIERLLPANPGSSGDRVDSHTGEASDVSFLTGRGPQQVTWIHTLDSVGSVLETKAPLGRACCHLILVHIARGRPFGEWEGSQRQGRDVARQADPCFAGLGASGITLQSRGRDGTGCLPSAHRMPGIVLGSLCRVARGPSTVIRALLPPLYRRENWPSDKPKPE